MRLAIVEAPSILGLFPRGVETLPDALLRVGLVEKTGARRAGRIHPPPFNPVRDDETGLRNPTGIADYSGDLADAVAGVLEAGEFPVVLGGDCSILLGCLLALRRSGRSGLLFLDGHADFYQPEAEPEGEVASMELAFAVGRGPRVLSDLESLGPLVRETDVAALGRRDQADTEAFGSQRIEESQVRVIDLATLRALGIRAGVESATARLERKELDGFWIHLDVDVLDDHVMPAVDYRQPDGLSWEELSEILHVALAGGKVRGLDVTIFNPMLDQGDAIAKRLVDVLADALVRAQ